MFRIRTEILASLLLMLAVTVPLSTLAEKNLDTTTHLGWIGGTGPQGAVVARLIMGEELNAKYTKATYYLDDSELDDPPEQFKGLQGVGYLLEGEGEYITEMKFRFFIFFKQKLKPENVHQVLDILDNPVKVSATEIK